MKAKKNTNKTKKNKNNNKAKKDARLDRDLANTFPASDPITKY